MKNPIRVTALFVAVAALTVPASADLDVTPSEFEESIVAGETITQELNLTWDGETDTVAELETTLKTEDGENVSEAVAATYSDNPVIVEPGGETRVDAEFSTHPGLKTGNYTILVEAVSEVEKETVSTGGGGGSGGTSGSVSDGENTVEINGEVFNETEIQDLVDSLEDDLEELEDLEDDKQGLEEKLDEMVDEELYDDVLQDKNELQELLDEKTGEERGLSVWLRLAGVWLYSLVYLGLVVRTGRIL